MKVILATNNKNKELGAERALNRYFKNIEIRSINVSSNVSSQPINEEIYKGAQNRIENLKKFCKQNNIDADLFLAVESGISNQLGEWQVISIIKIEDREGHSSFSTTTGFPIPEKFVVEIRNNGVDFVMRQIFGDNNTKKGIELLTNGVYNRSDWIEQGIIMGLIKVIHKGKWE